MTPTDTHLALALTGVFGYNSLLYPGLRFTTGINAALITGVAPLAISWRRCCAGLGRPLRSSSQVRQQDQLVFAHRSTVACTRVPLVGIID
jgi:hypothetical protein